MTTIDNIMALADALLFSPNNLRKKKRQALRAAIEQALRDAYRNGHADGQKDMRDVVSGLLHQLSNHIAHMQVEGEKT
jgi:flagellar biosynthesis/type III secretory pathway protein FliH